VIRVLPPHALHPGPLFPFATPAGRPIPIPSIHHLVLVFSNNEPSIPHANDNTHPSINHIRTTHNKHIHPPSPACLPAGVAAPTHPSPMKPAGAGDEEDVQVLVERPYSFSHSDHHQQQVIRARPYYRRWSPWLVSAATVATVNIISHSSNARDDISVNK